MGINVVRRSGISRALAVLGTGMVALPVIMLAAYAALFLALAAFVVIVVVVVSHPFRSAPVVVPVPDLSDDAMSRAVRARHTR